MKVDFPKFNYAKIAIIIDNNHDVIRMKTCSLKGSRDIINLHVEPPILNISITACIE